MMIKNCKEINEEYKKWLNKYFSKKKIIAVYTAKYNGKMFSEKQVKIRFSKQ